MTTNTLYQNWWQRPGDGEQGMEDEHVPQWNDFILGIEEQDLSGATVLDFGCNQGGFLRLLFKERPFQHGIGIDLALQAVEIANRRAQEEELPLEYHATNSLANFEGQVDLAVSTDVIYLLDDLGTHARDMASVLKENGVYYARHYDYASDPEADRLKVEINRYAAKKMGKIHTLHDIAEAFEKAGFGVSAQRIIPNRYIDMTTDGAWHADVGNFIDGQYERVHAFRFVKGDGFIPSAPK